jgi:hypothetical protein
MFYMLSFNLSFHRTIFFPLFLFVELITPISLWSLILHVLFYFPFWLSLFS